MQDSLADPESRPPRIAVVLPCFDEAATIGTVVRDFRTALPEAGIYVYDNNSRDDTAAVALAAGAVVRREPLQGKGHVVRRMFADVEADIYILADGDGTYHAASAPALVAALRQDGLDMVTGVRIAEEKEAYRRGHRLGNRVLTGTVAALFRARIGDMLSGYRVLSRRFVKSFPVLSQGFEIETEMTIHGLELGMKTGEVATPYGARPEGSTSKLNSVRDGLRILRTIVALIRHERPLPLFASLFVLLVLASLGFGLPVVAEFMQTGLVPKLPTVVLATALMLLAFMSLAFGVILDSVAHARREMKRLFYLSVPGPQADR